MLNNTVISPSEIFTPRSSEVNEKMYVHRTSLEKSFSDSLASGAHLLVYGESGCGKSWLYKKYFATQNIYFEVANLANASRYDSIAHELQDLAHGDSQSVFTGYKEKKGADVGVDFVAKLGAKIEHEKAYEQVQKDAFLDVLKHVRAKAGERRAFLVLDNLERIYSKPKLMEELADLITLLDDSRYSAYNVKLLIVGVPSGVREYFSRTPTLTTIANRIRELPEVSRLNYSEASVLIERGLFTELGFNILDQQRKPLIEHILWVTDCIPQKLHEYCLELSLLGIDEIGRRLDLNLLSKSDAKWLKTSLSSSYSTVEMLMNERNTKIGRRNQVLFCLGLVKQDEFKYSDVEIIVRNEFPDSTKDTALNIPQVLSELADDTQGVLKKAPKGDAYMFKDPVYRMCIRAMLKHNSGSEVVDKVDIKSI